MTSTDTLTHILCADVQGYKRTPFLLSDAKDIHFPISSTQRHKNTSKSIIMHIEVQVALNFVISYLYNKLPRRRVNIFGEELEKALTDKFQGHWYPEKPFKVRSFCSIIVAIKLLLWLCIMYM